MIGAIGIVFAGVQAGLWARRRRTLSRRPWWRIAVGAWAAVLIAHLAYEAACDRIVVAAARSFEP